MPGTKPATPPLPGVSWSLFGLLGVLLGGLFFYAGLVKHLAPYEFVEAVLAYQLAPERWAGAVAAVLPWVEITPAFFLVMGYFLEMLGRLALLCGLGSGRALLGGIKRRSCLLLLMAQTLLFLAALLITWARGLKIDCGCGLFSNRQVGPAVVLEDLVIFALLGAVYWWEVRTARDKPAT